MGKSEKIRLSHKRRENTAAAAAEKSCWILPIQKLFSSKQLDAAALNQ